MPRTWLEKKKGLKREKKCLLLRCKQGISPTEERECQEVTRIARPDPREIQKMGLTAKTKQEARDQDLATTVEVSRSRAMALMTKRVRIKTRIKKKTSSMTLVLVTYQAPLKCNKS